MFKVQLLIGIILLMPVSSARVGLFHDENVRTLIRSYFDMSFSTDDICGFLLCVHHIVINTWTVKRILKALGLKRRCNESIDNVARKIIQLHREGYENYGYKAMWKVLNTQCRMRVSQETVRNILKVIDPEGVRLRSRHCIRRRIYTSRGPHFLIHVDGYDKLVPFGIAIHGAIDGFSRRILWLKAGPSNKNHKIIAKYFIDYLQEMGRLPRAIRFDAGTENVLMRDIQIALRSFHSDNMKGENSVSVGRSTANQRIEMLWSFLRQHFTQFWRNVFKDMVDLNVLNNTDPVHLECLRFCFMPLIQEHLDSFKKARNIHLIRSQRRGELISGKPDVLFHQPVLFGARDCSFPFPCDISVLSDVQREYTFDQAIRGCKEEFIELVELVLGQRREEFEVATNVDEAEELFRGIMHLIAMFS